MPVSNVFWLKECAFVGIEIDKRCRASIKRQKKTAILRVNYRNIMKGAGNAGWGPSHHLTPLDFC